MKLSLEREIRIARSREELDIEPSQDGRGRRGAAIELAGRKAERRADARSART